MSRSSKVVKIFVCEEKEVNSQESTYGGIIRFVGSTRGVVWFVKFKMCTRLKRKCYVAE